MVLFTMCVGLDCRQRSSCVPYYGDLMYGCPCLPEIFVTNLNNLSTFALKVNPQSACVETNENNAEAAISYETLNGLLG